MFILKAILLGTLVAVHIVGGAFLFRRLFPRESVWLGFLVPEILVVLVCNFIEYHIALTNLRLLLPLTTAGSVASIIWPKCPWRVMRLPTLLFLGAFAFTLTLRLLRPNIEDARDGICDLSVIADFMYGQRLPAESTWLPPLKMEYYYYFEHYGASVLIRLLGIDLGTGFNLCVALLSAYTLFLVSAIAWHLTHGKVWIVLLIFALTAFAGPGDTGYLWLTTKALDPISLMNPLSLINGNTIPDNWFLRQLTNIPAADQHVLMSPAYGGWTGCFHSAQTGQLLICFSILSLIEMVRPKRTNWPWISLVLSPFLILVACTWGLPMVAFILIAGIFVSRRRKLVPENLTFVLAVSAGLATLLEPMLVYILEFPNPQKFTYTTGIHTQIPEFFVQWWPVYLPWLSLFFIWRRLHPVTRIILILSPLAFAGVETWTFGFRYDTTSKFWGLIYVAAWVTCLPEVARRKNWPFRLILLLIVVNGALSIGFWTTYYYRVVNPSDIGYLEGLGQFRLDRRKARILETVSRLDNQIIIPGRSSWALSESGLLPLLSHTRAYVAWSTFSDDALYSSGLNEGLRREVEVNKIYDGKNPAPLFYLRQRNIAALVIYPDDNIDPAVVDQLKQTLAPYYTYEDGNLRTPAQMEDGTSPTRPCAGVFIYHPEITKLLGEAKSDTQGP